MKDVSTLLALVSAVREECIERHLPAERRLTHLAFECDHPNYSRYCAYQNTYLTYLKQIHHPAFDELLRKGMGVSLTGDSFSSLHGDLQTGLFNWETRNTCGPFRQGFSTSNKSVNNWVQTIHIHSELRIALREMLKHKTSSKLKEMTRREKTLHKKHINNLKQKHPFSCGASRNILTGVINDMLRAPKLDEDQFNNFVDDWLVKGTVRFFTPIEIYHLKTGIIKPKKIAKAQTTMKEDCHPFGLIAAKVVSLHEVIAYPITSVPLAIANPDNTLR